MAIVVITGGSGLVGRTLSRRLRSDGHTVRILSRTNKPLDPHTFFWNPDKHIVEEAVFEGVDCLIHLAGEASWTKPLSAKRKEELRNSRIKSLAFLFETIEVRAIPLKTIISASAIGYYSTRTSDIPCVETESVAEGFWGTLCLDWEKEASRFKTIGIRTVILRTALVLSREGGFYPPLLRLVKLSGSTMLGRGSQHFPWIHIDDLCGMYQQALENQNMEGVFNAAAPDGQTNRSFIRHLAIHQNIPTRLPRIPSWCIRLALGKRAVLLLEGRPVSSDKILSTGFVFRFPDLDAALEQEMR